MISTDTHGSMAMSTVTVKGWSFTSDQTIDLEIWDDDKYVNTLTISIENGAVIHNARGE